MKPYSFRASSSFSSADRYQKEKVKWYSFLSSSSADNYQKEEMKWYSFLSFSASEVEGCCMTWASPGS